MESVKKSIGERAQHKMEYESRVNERQIQTKEEKTDTSNALDALDASSVIIESKGTESKEQDTSSRSGNDAHHTEQPEFNNEGKVDQNAEQCHDIRPLPAKLTDDRTTELSNQLLESENVCLKKTVAQCTSFNGQKQQRIDLNADALYNEKQENLRVWLLKLLISKKPAPFLNVQKTFEQRSSSLVLHQMTSDHNRSELGIHDHSNEPSSSKLVPKVVPLAVKIATSRQELELLFHHHIAMLRTTAVLVLKEQLFGTSFELDGSFWLCLVVVNSEF
ncbi:hypothetical protein Tco_0482056 [Tanacetum coccineum]